MLRLNLKPHPDFASHAVTSIEVEVSRPAPGRLDLRFVATGAIARVALPAEARPERTDELWRHTCFEAFVRAAPQGPYYEFNLAPSTQWAAYRFDAYRSGMTAPDSIAGPHIRVRSAADFFELAASLPLGRLADLPSDAVWQAGLSAVIEEKDGRISYWALAHPSGKPDFHHDDGFAIELPPLEQI